MTNSAAPRRILDLFHPAWPRPAPDLTRHPQLAVLSALHATAQPRCPWACIATPLGCDRALSSPLASVPRRQGPRRGDRPSRVPRR